MMKPAQTQTSKNCGTKVSTTPWELNVSAACKLLDTESKRGWATEPATQDQSIKGQKHIKHLQNERTKLA